LTLSKSQLLEVEKRPSSRDSLVLVDELTQEVNLIKTSETQLKEDVHFKIYWPQQKKNCKKKNLSWKLQGPNCRRRKN